MEDEFKNAIRARKKDDFGMSNQIISEILIKYPDHKAIPMMHTIHANNYQELGFLEQAKNSFEIALGLKPDLELASLGYYLLLIDLGLDNAAVIELERFITHFEPKMYLDTVKELYENIDQNEFSARTIGLLHSWYQEYDVVNHKYLDEDEQEN